MSAGKKDGARHEPSAFRRRNEDTENYTTWRDIGIEIPAGRGNVRAHCPQCAADHRSRSKTLSANVDDGLFQCFRCGFRGRVGGESYRNVISLAPRRKARDDRRKSEALRNVVSACVPLTDPTAEIGRRYLRARLGVTLVDMPKLGFCPALPYFETDDNGRHIGDFPALVATVRDVDARLVTLHRTYLASDGSGKAPVGSPKKLMTPSRGSVTGAAVRLYEATAEVIIAEGIETALALSYALERPAWACISAHGLATVELPASIRSVIIGADNDRSGAGQEAAGKARRRLEAEGRRVRVLFPQRQGQDWLDVLREGQS